jgi:hypothetical protein
VKLELIIKEVAENLKIPYKDASKVIKFGFLEAAKEMTAKNRKLSIRYLGSLTKKLNKRETYKKFLQIKRIKDENN